MIEQEQAFLDHNLVKVTKTRLVVPGEVYAMNGIISVKTTQTAESVPSSIKEKAIALTGLWVVFGALSKGAYLIHYDVLGTSIVILLLLLSWGTFISKKKISKYSITLKTSSGEVKALESQDLEFIQQVSQALNQAIVARG